jgi:hypothetical protein
MVRAEEVVYKLLGADFIQSLWDEIHLFFRAHNIFTID